ncbi:MAG: outer membrane protein transport protein [Pseudomonadales bacterium]|nr:outer membrane protein transport protein [Pseudomonadales bacterium]
MAQNLMIGNAKAIALGNAVTADPPGIDAIHFNPAGLAKLKGRQLQLKLVLGNADVYGEFHSNSEYQELLDRYGLQDPMVDTSSEIEAFAVYLPGSGVTEIPALIAPLGGVSYNPPASNFTLGTSVYAPLMLGYVRDENDIGRFYGKEIGMSRVTFFSPTIAWQVSDTFSFGMGIGFSYTGIGLNLDYRAANQLLGGLYTATNDICGGEDNGYLWQGVSVDLCGGEISPFSKLLNLDVQLEKQISTTVNLGFIWQPTPWFSLGLLYQSEADDRLEGDIKVSLDEGVIGLLSGLANSNAFLGSVVTATELTKNGGQINTSGYIDLVLPQHAALGISLQLFPDLKINIDYKWTETSKWEAFDFRLDEPLPILSFIQFIENIEKNAIIFPRGYEDSANFAFGIEYQATDRLAVRFGYEPRDSGVPKDKLDFLIPLGDFNLYGLGFSYQLAKGSIFDISLGYGKSDQFIPAGSSTNGNYNGLDNFVYNPSAGLDVRSVIEFSVLEFSYRTHF